MSSDSSNRLERLRAFRNRQEVKTAVTSDTESVDDLAKDTTGSTKPVKASRSGRGNGEGLGLLMKIIEKRRGNKGGGIALDDDKSERRAKLRAFIQKKREEKRDSEQETTTILGRPSKDASITDWHAYRDHLSSRIEQTKLNLSELEEEMASVKEHISTL